MSDTKHDPERRTRSRTMLIEELTLTNILSFGPTSQKIEFQPLSMFIGPNGSGKSNLLDTFELLRTAPSQMGAPVSRGGVPEPEEAATT